MMSVYLAAILIGLVAGLRTFTAPAAVSWAAYLGWLALDATPLWFLAFRFTPYILSVLAVAELVSDKLPQTPSRKEPMGFGARLVSGGLCGAALGAANGVLVAGLVAGVSGPSSARSGAMRSAPGLPRRSAGICPLRYLKMLWRWQAPH
jgi:uncharacterized membrane protein